MSPWLKLFLPATLVAVILAVIGMASVAVQQPFLVPSLGSAAAVQILTPQDSSGRPWNTFLGQFLGVGGGIAGVFCAAAVKLPNFTEHHLLLAGRVFAVTVATLLTSLLQLLCKATNPAGAATAIIIATGAASANWVGIRDLTAGILLVTILGEPLRLVLLHMQHKN